ncbi:sulfotransferase family 2 domain-containing protein [Tritonibacter horizontis]|uniref:Sulfotransferase family protein n=1 Tax=Tritonibacter horizontis TaxID=1768241 RepID=A0A132BZW6_9RHOB|nr:sulfotransferase family 2 domain-containing protein [Tritonibacter horizontis]KUP93310.1 sulfotransferase family protein [Tritonibacter horizontis]
MLSKNKQFLFIHVVKTAGTSMREVLNPYDWAQHPNGPHATMADYQDYLGERAMCFFSFAFVRNPYDWMVSLYEYMRWEVDHHSHAQASQMTFPEFVEWQAVQVGTLRQTDWLYNDGARQVDFLGRFETLAADFDRLRTLLNLRANLPHALGSDGRGQWREYYTPEARDILCEVWQADFENFGYSMELEVTPPDALPLLNDTQHVHRRLGEVAQTDVAQMVG